MKAIILDDKQREALAAVNAETPDRQLAPVPLPDGRWAVNADVLDDPQYWGRHLAALAGAGDGKDVSDEVEWQSANGKVEPVAVEDKAVVEASLAGLKDAVAAVELDPLRDFYVGELKAEEVKARYAAERARVEAVMTAMVTVKEEALVIADGK